MCSILVALPVPAFVAAQAAQAARTGIAASVRERGMAFLRAAQ